MKGSMITITVLVFLYLIGVFLSPKWLTFRHFIDAPPILKWGNHIRKLT